MDLTHIHAAGGIVVRNDPEPRIGIVQMRRNKAWVLPKGKLGKNETALAAARREVWEETGHAVSVHEFVGAVTYESRGLPKVVQFWRMQAAETPSRELMRDVRAVAWLPLKEAVERLSRAHERVFLANIGPVVLRAAREKERMAVTPRVGLPARRKKVARPRPTVPEPPAPVAVELAMAPAVEAVMEAAEVVDVMRIADVPPEPDAHAAATEQGRRPWLQRNVLDRLFGRAGV